MPVSLLHLNYYLLQRFVALRGAWTGIVTVSDIQAPPIKSARKKEIVRT
jgi:hypothetical protein